MKIPKRGEYERELRHRKSTMESGLGIHIEDLKKGSCQIIVALLIQDCTTVLKYIFYF